MNVRSMRLHEMVPTGKAAPLRSGLALQYECPLNDEPSSRD